MKKHLNSARSKFTILGQLCKLIPPHLVSSLAKEHQAESKARTFSHWSHVVALIFGKLSHAFGLNDLCDALQLYSGPLSAIRGATPPHRNTLSHANQERPSQMAEDLFWRTLEHLRQQSPGFGGRRRLSGRLRRFKAAIHLVDSTTIELVANCMPWAKHRRRKAAAKAHVRLDFHSLLPGYVVVDTARESDAGRARELCAGLKSGEVVVFDRAYVDLKHLKDLSDRGVVWVTRWKEGMVCDVLDRKTVPPEGKILSDEWVSLSNGLSARRIRALVEVDGKEREMVFLTNQVDWAASTVVELYKVRWEIEVFFKQLKQTLKLCDLIGYSANAIRWQVWIALLLHLLMRYLARVHEWSHSFVRLFALVRSQIWQTLDLPEILRRYGTAGGSYRNMAQPEQGFFPQFC